MSGPGPYGGMGMPGSRFFLQGVCLVHLKKVHPWQVHSQEGTQKRAVRILLKCILVSFYFQRLLDLLRNMTFSRYSESIIVGTIVITVTNATLTNSHRWKIKGLNVNVTSSSLSLVHITMRREPTSNQVVENPKIQIHNSSFGGLDLQPDTEGEVTDCYIDGTLKVHPILINLENSMISIQGCTFTRRTSEQGPTIILGRSKSHISIENTIFHKQFGLYGVICAYTGSALNVTNTNFTDNFAYEKTYSPLTLWKNANAIITNSVFENNLAFVGGAIWAGSGCHVRCYGSEFLGNKALTGGAIRTVDGTTLVLNDSSLGDNEALPGLLVSSKMIGGEGVSFALIMRASSGMIQNMNEVPMGGAMASTTDCVVAMESSHFHSNKAEKIGGVLAAGTNVSVTAKSCTFTGNSAKSFSGALNIYNNSSLVSLSCTFENNTVFVEGRINIFGAAISIFQDCKGLIEHTLFKGNKGWQGIVYTEKNVQLDVKNSDFTLNIARYVAGISANVNSSVNIESSVFTENTALQNFGAVGVNLDSILNCVNCTFNKNKAVNQTGSVILLTRSRAVFADCTFVRNSAGHVSGNVVVQNYSLAEVHDCYFTGNSAVEGGAINVQDNSSIFVQNSNFTNNTASLTGGAVMLLNQATSNFSRCNFDGNSAAQSGALHAQAQSKVYMDDVIFNKNSATNYTGGAISTILESVLHIQRSLFYSNMAKTYGGSIFVTKNGTVKLYNVEFDGNKVDVYGGAINIESNSSIKAVDCTFTRNFAKEKGAALTVTLKGSSANFTRCKFTDNFANINAGAIYTVIDSALNMDNCTFRNNTAMIGSGGAISVMIRSTTSIANSTFVNNTSVFGSAVHFFRFRPRQNNKLLF